MAVLLEKHLSYLFNSDTTTGAQNIAANGSSFEVSLNTPISIPKGAVSCEAGVVQAAIWNTSPNIAAEFKNNLFRFTTSQAPAGTYTFTVPDGLYSVAGLASYLAAQFVNLGLPSNLISLSGDNSTQKSILTFLISGDSINFTIANTVREVLGFDSQVLTAPSANYSFYSDNTAAFNRNNSYVIASNLVSQGIPVNSQSQGIIATVPIAIVPGSQVNYSPQNVVWFDAGELIGNSKINMRFMLKNQNLEATPTSGDTWSFVLVIRYQVLLAQGSLPLKPA